MVKWGSIAAFPAVHNRHPPKARLFGLPKQKQPEHESRAIYCRTNLSGQRLTIDSTNHTPTPTILSILLRTLSEHQARYSSCLRLLWPCYELNRPAMHTLCSFVSAGTDRGQRNDTKASNIGPNQKQCMAVCTSAFVIGVSVTDDGHETDEPSNWEATFTLKRPFCVKNSLRPPNEPNKG